MGNDDDNEKHGLMKGVDKCKKEEKEKKKKRKKERKEKKLESKNIHESIHQKETKDEDTTSSTAAIIDELAESSPANKDNSHNRKEKKRKDKKRKQKRDEENSSDSEPTPHKKSSRTDDKEASSQLDIETKNTRYTDNDDPRIVESSALDFGPEEASQKNGISLLLFYQYVEPIWSLEKYQQVLKDMEKLGNSLNLTGRMRVAREGLNCTLTATRRQDMLAFCKTLREQPEFQTTEFKFTNDLPEAQRFPQLKVIQVIELVHYGLEGEKAPPIQDYHGVHLEPKDYHNMIADKDTVMIDVRNHYEAIIGHFEPPNKDAMLDPLMRKSTEFPVWLDKPETKEKLKGRNVLMYCTGGIRCERATALLKYKMEHDPEIKNLGIQEVYQLQGGIDKVDPSCVCPRWILSFLASSLTRTVFPGR
jgi:predicted sulfurtransferase